MTEEEIKEARRISDSSYREDSIAGLEAHYEKFRALVPKLLDRIEHLTAIAKASHETSVRAGVIIGQRDQLLADRFRWKPVIEAAKAWRMSFPTSTARDALLLVVQDVFNAVDTLIAIEEEQRKRLREDS